MRLTLCGLGNGFRLRHQGADCPSSHGCRQPAQAVERRLPPVLVLGERAVSPRRLWLPFRRRGSTVAPTTLVAVVNGERPRVGEGCGRSPRLCLRLIVPRPHCVQQLAPRSDRWAGDPRAPTCGPSRHVTRGDSGSRPCRTSPHGPESQMAAHLPRALAVEGPGLGNRQVRTESPIPNTPLP